MKRLLVLVIIIALAYVGINTCLIILNETQQAVVIEFGKPVRTITEPGLNWKMPLIHQVRYFEKRLLEYDVNPAEIYTGDGKILIVDNYARWRIIDPLLFYQKVGTINGVYSRLDDIIYSEVRTQLGKYSLDEIVSPKRLEIMQVTTEESNKRALNFGIEVVDVRIKRADLPKENANSVYARMQANYQQIANRYRAEGEEEAFEIISSADKEQQILLAEAHRQAREMMGEGDAEALQIYAETYNKNPEFYQFLKTLETYEKTLNEDTTIILSGDSEYLKYIKDIRPAKEAERN